jgi:hypothetical protein
MKCIAIAVVALVTLAQTSYAADQKQIDQITGVIESFCLSGSSFSISGNVSGDITLKKLTPAVGVGAQTTVLKAKGGVGYINEQIRIAFDAATRDCMKPYIQQLIDLITAPPPPKQGRFITPEIDKVAVDSCNFKQRECGKPAADTFCRYEGYSRSVSFETADAGGDDTYRQGANIRFYGAGDGVPRRYLINVVCQLDR